MAQSASGDGGHEARYERRRSEVMTWSLSQVAERVERIREGLSIIRQDYGIPEDLWNTRRDFVSADTDELDDYMLDLVLVNSNPGVRLQVQDPEMNTRDCVVFRTSQLRSQIATLLSNAEGSGVTVYEGSPGFFD